MRLLLVGTVTRNKDEQNRGDWPDIVVRATTLARATMTASFTVSHEITTSWTVTRGDESWGGVFECISYVTNTLRCFLINCYVIPSFSFALYMIPSFHF